MRYFELILCISLAGCLTVQAPPLLDRHTVMESEAAGEWPELDSVFTQEIVITGPVPMQKEPTSNKKKRVYSIINGDLVSP